MMKLQKGYKQTEIGIIPEDWCVKELREILTFGNGIDYKHLAKGDIPVYGTGGIMTYVNDFLYDGEAVGIGRKGTINKPVFLNGKFWTVDTLFYAHNFKNVLSQLIYYNFHLINWFDYNEASGVPSLSKATIEKIRIQLPSNLSEQIAIAKVLTDTDQLIQILKTLIAKKKAIKQGAMQELLTGKKRLEGFSGDWKMKNMDEVLVAVSSGSSDTENENGEFLLYGSTGIIGRKGYFDYTGKRIIIARVGANAGSIYKVQGDYCVSDNAIMISCKTNLTTEYCYYFLRKQKLNKLVFGSGQPLITGSQIKEIEIALPALKEQIAIAQILSDMDAEIEALEIQLQKTQNLKQGMMQELLTGRTRLVKPVSQLYNKENKTVAIAAEPDLDYKKKVKNG